MALGSRFQQSAGIQYFLLYSNGKVEGRTGIRRTASVFPNIFYSSYCTANQHLVIVANSIGIYTLCAGMCRMKVKSHLFSPCSDSPWYVFKIIVQLRMVWWSKI